MPASKPQPSSLVIAAAAAFATYFCMYAFRKPFTAATFEGLSIWGRNLKTVLIVSQLAGYMLSKMIGIKVISEMRSDRRATTIIALILAAELALVGFAFGPAEWKVAMMFANGLPLGIVFGLVMSYLEGRRQTEALAAVLCTSFIVASGVVKSVGRELLDGFHVSETLMPMLTGLLFLPPLLAAVWVLQRTPPPDALDLGARRERKSMDRDERRQFVASYWPGLSLLLLIYIAVTIVRTLRDDYAVEIWDSLGADKDSRAVYAQSETIVGICVLGLSAMAICIKRHLMALRITFALMLVAFAVSGSAALLQQRGTLLPFPFMVACGIGLYVPYVAFHTAIFERFIAAAKRPCNVGFLLYVADSVGYLGYAAFIIPAPKVNAALFTSTLLVAAGISMIALVSASIYLERLWAGTSLEVSPASDEKAADGLASASSSTA
jgi:hypothetical protein